MTADTGAEQKARLRKGRRLLQKILPSLRAKVRKQYQNDPTKYQFTPVTVLGQSLTRFITEGNLDALLIYEDGPGRWYADISFKDTPVGMPNSIGTPINLPLQSRKKAEAAGRTLVETALVASIQNQQASHDTQFKDMRIFNLHDMVLKLPGADIDQLAVTVGQARKNLDGAKIYSELSHILIDATGRDHMDPETWEKINREHQKRILAKIATLMLCDYFCHPAQGTSRT